MAESSKATRTAAENPERGAVPGAASPEHGVCAPYLQNRELSWLEFNKRVLDQGADPAVPLFERLNFISIYWSNLQEFFMVRVGSLTDLALIKKTIIDSKSGMTPSEQLDAVYARCHELYPYYEACFKTLRAELAEEGIVSRRAKELTEEQLAYVDDYFEANIMPFLSPQIVNARHPFPHLENGALYIVVRLDEQAGPKQGKQKKKSKEEKAAAKEEEKAAKNLGATGVTLGIIPLPRQCDRIVQLPGRGLQFMLLEFAIEMFAARIFSMYKVKHTNIICVTRNADLDSTEGFEEQGEDYREHMKRILKKRARLAPVRLESERELSQTVKRELLSRLNLKEHQTFVSSVPLDMSYVFTLPPRVSAEVRERLSYAPFTPQWPAMLRRRESIIAQVAEHDVLMNYPYESMDAFVQLLREAAYDPDVVSIKITLYRLASQSHLAEALIAAAEMGKEVTALFELRARFDESNNIEWSQRFEQAGCHVIYGFRNYKVHSKICCITRKTPEGLQHITQLGTGNYNEKTAKLYTDFSFITTDARIGKDALRFFRNMALENTSDEYKTLWVAPLQIKQNILKKIDEQIALKRAGEPAGLFFKTNSITDKEFIDKIVEASRAGVQCTLLVRGISCLVPGVEGWTDNVCVVSIVGRLLEHSRIYAFGPLDGNAEVYLSSADLMTRNLDKRIEVAWPVLAPELKRMVIGYVGTCMADTAKLRDLLPNREYTGIGFFAKADERGRVNLFDSQAYLIDEAERQRMDAEELLVSHDPWNLAHTREDAHQDVIEEAFGEEASEFEAATDPAFAPVPEMEADAAPVVEALAPEAETPAPEMEMPAMAFADAPAAEEVLVEASVLQPEPSLVPEPVADLVADPVPVEMQPVLEQAFDQVPAEAQVVEQVPVQPEPAFEEALTMKLPDPGPAFVQQVSVPPYVQERVQQQAPAPEPDAAQLPQEPGPEPQKKSVWQRLFG